MFNTWGAYGKKIYPFFSGVKNCTAEQKKKIEEEFGRPVTNILPMESRITDITGSGRLMKDLPESMPYVNEVMSLANDIVMGRRWGHGCCFCSCGGRNAHLSVGASGIALCAAFAGTDEYHQTFVDGRTGQVTDVLIDTAGACVGCLLYGTYYIAFRLGYRRCSIELLDEQELEKTKVLELDTKKINKKSKKKN